MDRQDVHLETCSLTQNPLRKIWTPCKNGLPEAPIFQRRGKTQRRDAENIQYLRSCLLTNGVNVIEEVDGRDAWILGYLVVSAVRGSILRSTKLHHLIRWCLQKS